MIEILKFSWSNILAFRNRSLIAILTMLLGSIATVATFTINANVNYFFDSIIERSGGPMLVADFDAGVGSFNKNDIEVIKGVPIVKGVFGFRSTNQVTLRKGDLTAVPFLFAAPPEFNSFWPVAVQSGTFLSHLDEWENSNAIVLSPLMAKKLSIDANSLEQITVNYESRSIPSKVVGIAIPANADWDSGWAWMPQRSFVDLFPDFPIMTLRIRVDNYQNLFEAERALNALLKSRFARPPTISNPASWLLNRKREFNVLVSTGYVLGILALFSGSIGIMNMMSLAVGLRRREIGLYKAFGFRDELIRSIFLIEAFLISFFGGAIGVSLGLGLARAVCIHMTPPFIAPDPIGTTIGFLVTLSVGTLSGLLPAKKAMNLDPLMALKT